MDTSIHAHFSALVDPRVESGLHCRLNIAFREDQSRVRLGCAAENFAVIRHALGQKDVQSLDPVSDYLVVGGGNLNERGCHSEKPFGQGDPRGGRGRTSKSPGSSE